MRDNTEQSSSKAVGAKAGQATGLSIAAKKKIAAGVGIAALVAGVGINRMRSAADEAAGRFFEQDSGAAQKLENEHAADDSQPDKSSGSGQKDMPPIIFNPEASGTSRPFSFVERVESKGAAKQAADDKVNKEQEYVEEVNGVLIIERDPKLILEEKEAARELFEELIKPLDPKYQAMDMEYATGIVHRAIATFVERLAFEAISGKPMFGLSDMTNYRNSLSPDEQRSFDERVLKMAVSPDRIKDVGKGIVGSDELRGLMSWVIRDVESYIEADKEEKQERQEAERAANGRGR